MSKQVTYMVQYADNDGKQMSAFKASSSGEAFAQFLAKAKGPVKLIKAIREGSFGGEVGRTEFLPPPKYT